MRARRAPGYTEITIAPAGRSADDPIEELSTPFAAPQACWAKVGLRVRAKARDGTRVRVCRLHDGTPTTQPR